MKSQYPRVSIVTPSFNQGRFLEETIISVLDQGYPNLEYIIIDGGSSDNSVSIIKKYEYHLSYWVSENDRGQTHAINKGFNKCTGDILHWLNSDDVLLPCSLDLVAEFFEQHPDIDCLIGDLEVINSKGQSLTLKKAIPFDFKTALYTSCLVPQPSTFFTRRAWEKTGYLDISLHYQMDFEYFLRMAKAGIKFGLLNKPLAKFRLHEDSKTVSEYNDLFFESYRRIQDQYLTDTIKNMKFKEEFLDLMNIYYKARSFFIRALMRRDFIPYKHKRSRKNI
ncbi:glycosyltransferase [Desulfobacteraceae bacterium SEEP-SAG10]|nr:glycosyltransferase [Desulfobacteraceae bacterium SEEP-SAG10]